MASLVGLRYSARVETVNEALDHIHRAPHRIILTAPRMPDGTVLDILAGLGSCAHAPAVVTWADHANEAVLYYLSNGAIAGFVPKTESVSSTLRECLVAVLAGGTFLPGEFRIELQRWRSCPWGFHKLLTKTELELLPVLGRGVCDREASRRVGVSTSTIKTHRRNIMHKLDLHRREQLMAWCAAKGFCDITCGDSREGIRKKP